MQMNIIIGTVQFLVLITYIAVVIIKKQDMLIRPVALIDKFQFVGELDIKNLFMFIFYKNLI